ncbi:nucleotidyltransferase [Sporosarcina sp. PTS2304]|uniref:nucleotidyltransferase domain-containing protein n=1 Tax=Sporosarcina sp. PTS2304 TaxID=2283194 RepID=UPI000E0DEAC9|nr:nucleotidyltransferase [Sporosarcina sp. PTS2304]AXH99223.1 nucleotidyltransferase [Sporosarcina sp. PTS2304]
MNQKTLLVEMLEQLDLPKSVEEKVHKRYQSIAEWFMRDDSTLMDVDIFVQGSFGQGTTIKPLREGDEYDLDMSCKVNIPNFKSEYTQKELMDMMKNELELYRKKVGIHHEVKERRRCIRLCYKDEVPFHIDFVPSIPLEEKKTNEYRSMLFGSYKDNKQLAANLAIHAVNIPDKEKDSYNVVSEEWHISNQQGYLLWFQNKITLKKRGIFEASIEPIPTYGEKSVLQRCIQLLKRHRDTMFEDTMSKDSKPISIIITTLAARAYNGEESIEEAIINILNTMRNYISASIPRISNPVMPEEDFTDRWDNPDFERFELEKSFYLWLEQAKTDFNQLVKGRDVKEIRCILEQGFALDFSEEKLQEEYGYKLPMPQRKVVATPSVRPWRRR